jgi:hypothetical protein
MIIQSILLEPSGAVWTDAAGNVSRPDPSGAVQVDAEHPARNRKVVGSNPTSGSKAAGQRAFLALLTAASTLPAAASESQAMTMESGERRCSGVESEVADRVESVMVGAPS